MSKDYYKILGVTEFNSAEEIKSAYRKLARKYHPDIAGNTPDILKKFKEINEAYDILSNKLKKEEYDRAQHFYKYAQGNSYTNTNKKYENTENKSTNPNTSKTKFNFNWEDFLGKKYKETFSKRDVKAPINGSDTYSDIEISVFEALCGTTKSINVLQTHVCPKCKGKKFVNSSICPECNGKGEFSDYKKFTIKIPAEIKDGSKIRLAGEGVKGLYGGKNGDLYLTIHIKENTNDKTVGLNIFKTITIAPHEAVLGTSIQLNTINGNINFKIAPNTQNGQKIRLAKCGITENNLTGDMILTVEIKIPKNLSEEEIKLYRQLEKISQNNVHHTDVE